jgi:DNA-binding beta-propeller fold protein YncE
MGRKRGCYRAGIVAALAGFLCSNGTVRTTLASEASQPSSGVPQYQVDPNWPKPLPDNWVTGQLGGVCVDARDHVFVVNRQDLEEKETETATSAPPVIEFDPEGNVVNSFGDPKVLPKSLHGCFVDRDGNFWVAGSGDGVVQKYSHDGSKLLLQIGVRGVVDSSDGSLNGRALNSSHTAFFNPAGIAVDPSNGDIYVADGYDNSRIAVFNSSGEFLRQWGHQGTAAEAEAGVGGAFLRVVHCVVMDNTGFVYVCDKQGDRIQVFDKMGEFKRNIMIDPRPHYPNSRPISWGAISWVGFSPDPGQHFLFAVDEWRDQIHIFNRTTGRMLASFGRPGHQTGEFTHCHTMAVDSKGNIYVAETGWGRRVQKFKIVGSQ